MNTIDKPRIAIIGGGISGIYCAHHLQGIADVTLFEKDAKIGGHTNTEYIERAGKQWPVNTGFIVYNDWTYPGFIDFLSDLGVENEPSSMSFSVRCDVTGVEYNGTTLNTLFAQRRNLLSPGFIVMILDILRFNRALTEASRANAIPHDMTLGAYLDQGRYSKRFRDHYIIPMGAAIWSCGTRQMLDFPLAFFARFFDNHGMLSVDNRPQWRVVKGGSIAYVDAFQRQFSGDIVTHAPVTKITRSGDGVSVTVNGQDHTFDEVIMACHSDQALSLLGDPSSAERDVLSAIRYQDNDVVLHTDTHVLPRQRRAWAAWNYRVKPDSGRLPSVTYNMNILQNFELDETFCVTLNDTASIDSARIIKKFNYSHPVYTQDAVAAQARHHEISGVNHTHYCGAYWLNGFHEDGVASARRVIDMITDRYARRAGA